MLLHFLEFLNQCGPVLGTHLLGEFHGVSDPRMASAGCVLIDITGEFRRNAILAPVALQFHYQGLHAQRLPGLRAAANDGEVGNLRGRTAL